LASSVPLSWDVWRCAPRLWTNLRKMSVFQFTKVPWLPQTCFNRSATKKSLFSEFHTFLNFIPFSSKGPSKQNIEKTNFQSGYIDFVCEHTPSNQLQLIIHIFPFNSNLIWNDESQQISLNKVKFWSDNKVYWLTFQL
jgi:hypothetical protein